MAKEIFLDTETTGLAAYGFDKILELAIVDSRGHRLFNERIKPDRRKVWKEAQRIHGISYDDVKNCQTIRYHKKKIQKIFSSTEYIVGYNTYFDLTFLATAGIHIPDNVQIVDVMEVFAEIYGEWNDYFQSYKWQKLVDCADYFKYKWKGNAHGALSDTLATLHCYKGIRERFPELLKKYTEPFDKRITTLSDGV